MTLRYCSMCEGFYSDPARHRYIECPFFNGCACGLKHQNQKHVKVCFMAKEIKRKEKPMIQNNPEKDPLKCSYCFREYAYEKEEHEKRFCPFFVGCPFCGAKKISSLHVDNCKSKMLAGSMPKEEKVCIVCQYCRKDVDMEKWEDHRKKGCDRENIVGIIEETMEILGEPDQWCARCGKHVPESFFSQHDKDCKELVSRKYAIQPQKESGELVIMDERPKASLLKEVQFVEGPL